MRVKHLYNGHQRWFTVLTSQPGTHLSILSSDHHLMVIRSGFTLHPTQGWHHSCPPTWGLYQFYTLVWCLWFTETLPKISILSIGRSTWEACAGHAPLRAQILSFWHTKFSKRNCLRSPRPPTGSTPPLRGPRPPYGESWIRHCFLFWLAGTGDRIRVTCVAVAAC